MSNFLYAERSAPPGIGMGSFSSGHIFWILLSFAALFFVTRYYRRANEESRRRIKRNIVIAMFADEALKWFVTISTGQWTWAYLPLHLCSISMFVALLHYRTERPLAEEFLFAVSLPGAAMALLFPNWINLPFFNIMSMHSFSIHLLIVMYPCLLLAGGFRPDIRHLPRLAAYLAIGAALAFLVNSLLGTNFFFMNGADEGNPLSILEKYVGPWYRLGFIVLAFLLWTILYGAVYLLDGRKTRAGKA